MKQKRDKILLILLSAIIAGSAANFSFAVTPAQNITIIENHIFGHENKNMSEGERLSQIEKFVYGSPQSGNIKAAQRIKKLNEDLGLAPDEKPKMATQSPAENLNQSKNSGYAPYQDIGDDEIAAKNEAPDPSAQYPIVDNIENSVLKKTFKNENIYKRLDRLETQAYGKTLKGSLSERVERLSKLAAPIQPKPEDNYNNRYANNDDYNYFSPDTEAPTGASAPIHIGPSPMSPSAASQLAYLEQEAFGRTYSSESDSQRLSRLEKATLHKEFSSEPNDVRVERLSTVTTAQKSQGVYKENKLMQHLSTGVQIGGMILMILAMIL